MRTCVQGCMRACVYACMYARVVCRDLDLLDETHSHSAQKLTHLHTTATAHIISITRPHQKDRFWHAAPIASPPPSSRTISSAPPTTPHESHAVVSNNRRLPTLLSTPLCVCVCVCVIACACARLHGRACEHVLSNSATLTNVCTRTYTDLYKKIDRYGPFWI